MSVPGLPPVTQRRLPRLLRPAPPYVLSQSEAGTTRSSTSCRTGVNASKATDNRQRAPGRVSCLFVCLFVYHKQHQTKPTEG